MPAVPASLPRATLGGPVAALGQHRQVIDAVGASRTLAPEESGALCLFDAATGQVFTLPAPVVGMQFEFLVKVTITSGSSKVLTDSAATFLVGGAGLLNSGAATGQFFAANGTTHRSVNGNGSTTGGIIGDRVRFTATSSTLWQVDGLMNQTGTAASPFATS